jgi:hypothetical protein
VQKKPANSGCSPGAVAHLRRSAGQATFTTCGRHGLHARQSLRSCVANLPPPQAHVWVPVPPTSAPCGQDIPHLMWLPVSAGADSAMPGMVARGNSWRLWDGSRKMNGDVLPIPSAGDGPVTDGDGVQTLDEPVRLGNGRRSGAAGAWRWNVGNHNNGMQPSSQRLPK